MERARERPRRRFAGSGPANTAASSTLQCNGDMGPAEVRQYGGLDETGKGLLRSAMP